MKLIDESIAFIKDKATKKGIVLRHTIGDGLNTIEAYKTRLKQVLINLLSNAVKLTPAINSCKEQDRSNSQKGC